MRLAVFGGSFNPPHIGHLALADAVHTELGFDRVLFIPTHISPLKGVKGTEALLDASLRFEMLSLAAEDSGFLMVSDCEIRRGGISYTADTLRFVLHEYAGKIAGKPALIMGADWIPSFHLWRNAEEIAGNADLILARRPGFAGFPPDAGPDTGRSPDADKTDADKTDADPRAPVRLRLPGLEREVPVFFVDNPELQVSSSDIRRRIASGKSWRYLVPEPVHRYIRERGLYVQ